MKVLLFGSTGQVGSEIKKICNAIEVTREIADLIEPSNCIRIIENTDANIIINAAAYTSVDKAESEEFLANIVNGESPTVMAKAASKKNIPIIHISTDYVFDGKGKQRWNTNDKTEPLNAYGRSKLLGERGVQASNANYVILRTSWVFSSHGSNFVKTMLALSKQQNQLKIVADQIGGPTSAHSIAQTCIKIAKALLKGEKVSGVYHFSGSKDTTWAQFAQEIFKQLEIKVKINEISSDEFLTRALRPKNTRLDCNSLRERFGIDQSNWKKELHQVLKDLKQ